MKNGEVYTNDTPEWVDKCLNCKEPGCRGACPERGRNAYRARVRAVAEAIHSGLTIKQAAQRVGIAEIRAERYLKTKLFAHEMRRLRG